MSPDRWNDSIRTLLLIRLGQELGADTELTRAIRDLVVAILAII